MRRQLDSAGPAARTGHHQPAAGPVGDAPCHAAVLENRARPLRTCVRGGHRVPACRNRRHCEQPGQADVRQHDCGAGTERPTPRPHRGGVLQPAERRHVGRDAGNSPARAAQADGAVERHFAQPRIVRAGKGGLRTPGLLPEERRQETAGRHLQELRPQRRGAVGRRQGTLPPVYLRTFGPDASVRAECAGGDQRVRAQHHRPEAGGRTACFRQGGDGGRRQGPRRKGLDRDLAGTELCAVRHLLVEPCAQGKTLARLQLARAGRPIRQHGNRQKDSQHASEDSQPAGLQVLCRLRAGTPHGQGHPDGRGVPGRTAGGDQGTCRPRVPDGQRLCRETRLRG